MSYKFQIVTYGLWIDLCVQVQIEAYTVDLPT